MPIYEYFCSSCHTKFDALRAMSEADAKIKCTNCESQRTARVLSVFFAATGASAQGGYSEGGGGGCGCGGACACGHSHN